MSEPVLDPEAVTAVPSPADVAPRAEPAPGTPADGTTGDDAVDEALRRLEDVEQLDLRAQVGVLEDIHGALQDRLADGEG